MRRGPSFRTEGGPALVLLTLGYTAVMVLDPIAARERQAPLVFARLRPPQMLIAAVSLLALTASVWLHR